jgi:ribonucleoside-diphosphate reductase alpha chain
MAAVQQHMPRRRNGHTTSVTIGGERFYLTANARADGSLGEVFIQWGKQGSSSAGLRDLYSIALSVGLRHGVLLAELVRQGLGLWFLPNGRTDDPDIPRARSVVDWVARRLAIDWLPYEERADLGVFTADEVIARGGDWLAHVGTTFAPVSAPTSTELEAFRAELANGIGVPVRPRI